MDVHTFYTQSNFLFVNLKLLFDKTDKPKFVLKICFSQKVFIVCQLGERDHCLEVVDKTYFSG